MDESIDDIAATMHLGDDGDVVGGVIGIDTGSGGDSILGIDRTDAASSEPVRLTHIQPPRLIKRVSPIYPIAPIKAHIEGVVTIEAVTDIYGRVVNVRRTVWPSVPSDAVAGSSPAVLIW